MNISVKALSIVMVVCVLFGIIFGVYYLSGGDVSVRHEDGKTTLQVTGQKECDNETIQGLREKSLTEHDNGNYDGAIGIVSIAIQQCKHSWELFRIRGASYKELGQHEKSIEDYKEVIRLNPSRERAHLTLVESHIFSHRYDDALRWMDRYGDSLTEEGIRDMFEYFRAVITIVSGKAFDEEVYAKRMSKSPCHFYRGKYWRYEPLLAFVAGLGLSDETKHKVTRVSNATQCAFTE